MPMQVAVKLPALEMTLMETVRPHHAALEAAGHHAAVEICRHAIAPRPARRRKMFRSPSCEAALAWYNGSPLEQHHAK